MNSNKALFVLVGMVLAGLWWASAQTKDSARVSKEAEFVLEVPLLAGAENLVPLDLPLVAEEAVPAVGTFWSASRYEFEPPLPFNRFPDLPVYALGNGQLLLDDRAVDFNLWLQQLTTWQMLSRAARGEALAEPPVALRVVQNYNGVDLLLDLEDITNGVAAFTLYCPSNDVGYDLFGTTNLSVATEAGALNATNWTWLYRAVGGETNVVIPLTWLAEGYFRLAGTNDMDADTLSDAFETLVSHSSASTNDSDGDGLLDAWEWTHFGNFTQTGTNDVDLDGLNHLAEQANGSDPNELAFTAAVGYGRVNTPTPSATLAVTRGLPAEVAVVVGTNFNSVSWQPFTASPLVSLPDADGPHAVWFAARGRVFTNAVNWQGLTVTLDRAAPSLTVTHPTNALVFQPILQITGWSTDAVWAVSCAVSNAAGFNTNLSAYVTGRDRGVFVTNRWQCFDVELTNGVNLVALAVTDLAGNTTYTNLSLTYDPAQDTNAPQFTLHWPRPDSVVAQSRLTLRAQVDDATAFVTATVANATSTNKYWPLVERTGAVWVDDLELASGTNWITLTATDAAANERTTNFMVIRSPVSVSVNPPSLILPTTSVSGTVSEAGQFVWVNGLPAIMDGTNWSVPTLPLVGAGPVVVAVTVTSTNVTTNPNATNAPVTDPGELNPPGGSTAGLVLERPATVRLVSGSWEESADWSGETYNSYDDEWGTLNYHGTRRCHWNEATGGYAEYFGEVTHPEWLVPTVLGDQWHTTYRLHPDGTEEFTAWEVWYGETYTYTNQAQIKQWYWGNNFPWQRQASGERAWHTNYDEPTFVGGETLRSRAEADLQLDTGGRAAVKQQSIIRLYASAASVTTPHWGTSESVPPEQTHVPGFGALNTNGYAEQTKPDNTTQTVTATTATPLNTQSESAGKYRLEIRGMGQSGNLAGKTIPVIVGQRISLSAVLVDNAGAALPGPTNVTWTVPGYAISSFFVTSDTHQTNGFPIPLSDKTNEAVHFHWTDGAKGLMVRCNAEFAGERQSQTLFFNVKKNR
jgi:hypothetical protein